MEARRGSRKWKWKVKVSCLSWECTRSSKNHMYSPVISLKIHKFCVSLLISGLAPVNSWSSANADPVNFTSPLFLIFVSRLISSLAKVIGRTYTSVNMRHLNMCQKWHTMSTVWYVASRGERWHAFHVRKYHTRLWQEVFQPVCGAEQQVSNGTPLPLPLPLPSPSPSPIPPTTPLVCGMCEGEREEAEGVAKSAP